MNAEQQGSAGLRPPAVDTGHWKLHHNLSCTGIAQLSCLAVQSVKENLRCQML